MCGPEGDHSHQSTESSPQPSHFDKGTKTPQTLILCFDGTNDSFDETSTNIVRLFAALEKGRPREQLVYYQPGIGTYVRPEAPWAPHVRDVAKVIDKGLAWYIGTHITGGYKFLMQHYNEGDRICLFGFSRGAFTARCLAGMLHKVGLLPRSNMEHVDFAYTLYESRKDEDIRRAQEFKKTFSVHVEVEFVGVWDTVSSVGFGAPLLPFNASETFVRTFRHALAIDERRAKFQANPWKYRKSCECGSTARTQDDGFKTIEELTGNLHAACESKKDSLCWCKDDKLYHGGLLTDVLEVWFPGFHADVGGGNENNSVTKTLANPSLRWMVTEILKANPGVIFKKDAFEDRLPSLAAKVKAFQNANASAPTSYLDVKSHHHGHTSEATVVNGSVMTPPLTPGSPYIKKAHEEAHHNHVEEPTEQQEANGEWHDMLVKKWWLWCILEVIPLTQTYINKKGQEVEGLRWNWGMSRSIDHPRPRFHRSVKYRMESTANSETKYDPHKKCRYPQNVKWVHEDDDLPEHNIMYGPDGNHSHHNPQGSQQSSHFGNGDRKPRTLVLCFDGTNDVFDETSTNIIRLFAALEKGRPSEQLVYYQPGIGTYVRPEAPWAPAVRDVAMLIDKGFAWYIGTHITGGYKFIMQHYNEGDRICLFGFSRGAFTARCLAGMLHKVGLLPRSNMEHVDFAYTLYESRKEADIRRAQEFKKTFSVHVEVEFVGVWDTVASVGVGAPTLPFNASETFVRTFRHALAIDERRAKFQPNPWQYRKKCECGSNGRTQDDGFKTIEELNGSQHAACLSAKGSLCWCKDDKKYHGGKLTDVVEVWFPGFHAGM
ncbi:hypothetical protein M407DRAFT_21055 [Tulasnella calospora MUT 4182]|uniref:T6SS Phospholipase effector Tle1-like catalytic domain-containing protein n=1 Tax=Tulasnella calospora MUT 4182 TaxID=1051891 RepID=A0A0C3QEW4_9AGAM|nr:hypothetical protein M407DRAFT_21055 [Tulasnella calospora MUT 4182]